MYSIYSTQGILTLLITSILFSNKTLGSLSSKISLDNSGSSTNNNHHLASDTGSASTSHLNSKSHNAEYDKYYASLNRNFHKIPTLENLFHVTKYWDNNNKSSPCLHVGKKRSTLCHKVTTFDRDGYEKSLQDTRKLILSRLNLEQEPHVNVNEETLDFINQLESKLLNEQHDSGHNSNNKNKHHATIKTSYDKRTSENKEFNSMHEAIGIDYSCNNFMDENAPTSVSEQDNQICVNFDLPIKNNFIKVHSNGIKTQRKMSSAILWLFVRTLTTQDDDPTKAHPKIRLQIQNLNQYGKNINTFNLNVKNINDGWNTINITSILRFPNLLAANTENGSDGLKLTLAIKCAKNCSIGYTNNDLFSLEESMMRDVLVDNNLSRKPLLSINMIDDDDMPSPININFKNVRNKRKANNHAINYKAYGIDRDNYNPKLCVNNYPDADRECCLITYYVNFNSLKWSSWILSPAGFVANYCSGKCNELKSFKYASHNAEVKLKYNERLLFKDSFDSREMLETCCHPISMDSLVVKYLAGNGSVISTVIPNMIVTGCGCS